jgi:pilus assembly protein Flp/PilA
MTALAILLAHLAASQRAVTALEYGLIAAVIGGVVITASTSLGADIVTAFGSLGTALISQAGNMGG